MKSLQCEVCDLHDGAAMANPLGFDALVQSFHDQLDHLPDTRRGKNIQFSIKDAALFPLC